MELYCYRCDIWNEIPIYVIYPTPAEIVCVQCGALIFRGYIGPLTVNYNSDTTPFLDNIPPFSPLVPESLDDFNDMPKPQPKKRPTRKVKTHKHVKRHIKVIYKGKFGEDANNSGHSAVVRKPKKAL